MKKLHGKIHCALQTSGFAAEEVFEKVLSACDYVLFDLKLFDEEKHKKYCGENNRLILENYKLLSKSGKEFITRVPLISTVTDTEENIASIAAFMSSLSVKKVELLPYNKLTGSKYSSLLRKYGPSFDEAVPVSPREDIFRSFGISARVL